MAMGKGKEGTCFKVTPNITEDALFLVLIKELDSPGISKLIVTVVYLFVEIFILFLLHSSQATEMRGMGSLTC